MEELELHSRSIILNEIGMEGIAKLKKSAVLVIGAGGIASSALQLLASSGICNIWIADFDTLSPSNLQRQTIYKYADCGKSKVNLAADFLRGLNPFVSVHPLQTILNEESFESFKSLVVKNNINCIIDTSDNFNTRLITNNLSIATKTPLLSAACIAFTIHLYSFKGYEQNMPCYSCLFASPDDVRSCANTGVFAPAVAISGSLLACQVLKYLLKINDKDMFLQMLVMDAKSLATRITKIKKDTQCKCCSGNLASN